MWQPITAEFTSFAVDLCPNYTSLLSRQQTRLRLLAQGILYSGEPLSHRFEMAYLNTYEKSSLFHFENPVVQFSQTGCQTKDMRRVSINVFRILCYSENLTLLPLTSSSLACTRTQRKRYASIISILSRHLVQICLLATILYS